MKKLSLLLAGLIAACSLAGCSASSGNAQAVSSSAAQYSTATFDTPSQAPEKEVTVEEAASSEFDAGSGNGVLPPSVDIPGESQRKIIWRVYMSMETLDFGQSISEITAAVEGVEGYIESSSISGNSLQSRTPGNRYASIVARVPEEQLDNFLQSVSAVGNVVSTDRSSEDVTLEYSDIETRKRSLEVEQERLLELLGQAEDIDTIVALESRLSEIRYQLDDYTSSLLRYDSLVDYSTVSIDLNEVQRISDPVAKTMSERISSGFSQTLYNIKVGAQDLIVWFVVNLPYLLLLLAFILIILLIIRLAIRHGAKRRAQNPPAPPRRDIPNRDISLPPNPYRDPPAEDDKKTKS